jgi:hypothetical protein
MKRFARAVKWALIVGLVLTWGCGDAEIGDDPLSALPTWEIHEELVIHDAGPGDPLTGVVRYRIEGRGETRASANVPQ